MLTYVHKEWARNEGIKVNASPYYDGFSQLKVSIICRHGKEQQKSFVLREEIHTFFLYHICLSVVLFECLASMMMNDLCLFFFLRVGSVY